MTKGRAKSSNMRVPIVTLGRLVARKFTPCERQRPCSPRWKYCHFTRYWIRILLSTFLALVIGGSPAWAVAIQRINGQNRCHVRSSDVCALYVLRTVQFRQRDDSANDYQISNIGITSDLFLLNARGATGGHPISNTTTATTTFNVNTTTGYSADTWHVGCLKPLRVRSLPFVPLLRCQFCNLQNRR
jgi:hypothetical protein